MTEHGAGLLAALRRELPRAAHLRRQIHASPRLSGDEHDTAKLIVESLSGEAEIVSVAETGVAVRIGESGPAIGIRAELDALPVDEQTNTSFASSSEGVMHACGHDVHAAALWAVVRALQSAGAPSPLVALFQPREETYPSGAQDVIRSAVLAELACTQMIGVHLQPLLAPGSVACAPGVVNASSDQFTLTMVGRSGHAAYPHLTNDPVIALAETVVALQTVAARAVSPTDSVVLGVSTLRAGRAANTIPGEAEATGIVRALSADSRRVLHRRLVEVASAVAQAHGCEATVNLTLGEPVLHNDADLARRIAQRLDEEGIPIVDSFRSLGSDDFAFYCEVMPSAMLFVGTDARSSLHSPTFLPSERDLRRVAETMLLAFLAAGRRTAHPVGRKGQQAT